METWYQGEDIVVDAEYPTFENRSLGFMWFTVRRDRLITGDIAVRVVGTPTFLTARAKADCIVLSARRAELWRQVEEVKAMVSPKDDQEKAIRLADRLGNLMVRLGALGVDLEASKKLLEREGS